MEISLKRHDFIWMHKVDQEKPCYVLCCITIWLQITLLLQLQHEQALLLMEGKTLRSLFKLPISLTETSNGEENQNYPVEFLNSLTPSGMPLLRLNSKVGTIFVLLRNLCINQGLCNRTRLKVACLPDNCTECIFISGSCKDFN